MVYIAHIMVHIMVDSGILGYMMVYCSFNLPWGSKSMNDAYFRP